VLPDHGRPTESLADIVDRVFAPGGPIAAAITGFEPRESQRTMAASVAETLEDGGVLLVEAGTGTGKTLAYLVPAILRRERVLVSTGTKNLQEQIYFKDLPVLEQALGVPFKATCMKGRGNYLCLHRFATLRDQAATSGLAAALPGFEATYDARMFLAIIDAWAAGTETGDRAEIADLPEDLPLWNDVAATAENCLGGDCPRYDECYVTRMRQRAADSDVVIVNHHLLFADAALRRNAYGEVIPECRHAVLDEAHQLEDIATQYFGVAVSTWGTEEVASDIERWSARVLPQPQRNAVLDGVEHLRRHARRFFTALDGSRTTREERVRLTNETLESAAELGTDVTGTLDGLEATLLLIHQQTEGGEPVVRGAAGDELLSLARRAKGLREDLRFLLRASDPDFVYFLEVRGRGVFLRAAPIEVSQIVREAVLDRRTSTVLTSATLTVAGSFEYVRRRLGVGRARELRLASEFDYAEQAILYLPRRMPHPKLPAFGAAAAREIVSILQATEGRAFVLFTSYAMLRLVQPIVEDAVEYPILVQGTAPRSLLLTRFRETPHAVLLATSSFWQGVDVIGDALSCVIVDKLPFASPADPITAARLEAIGARGGDPFGEYQVPLAILTLQQGLGRLLRHRLDRGVLAVLDPRLRTMGYGRRFLESLPPAPITSDPGDITRFFALTVAAHGSRRASAAGPQP
jgi:ATP-dependent DNA helicase DinG